jgi:alkyldihydroxyacetonephosphate synthase
MASPKGLSDKEVSKLCSELGKISGAKNVLARSPETWAKFPGDQSWITYIHIKHGVPLNRPDAVVTVRSTEEAAKVVKLANKLGVPVTPIGGGSGVQGAANANRGGIQVNFREMKKIRHLDKKSLTCTVEPGYIVKTFEEDLNKKGLTFTHYPASAEWASVAGSIAARGSGVLSTKYGNIQDHVLSCEIVTPTGDIMQLPSVPKHGVGPDMTQLMVGSEGTLGLITASTVKLRNVPVKREFRVLSFKTVEAGVEAGRQIMTTGLRPAVMRFYDKDAATKSLEKAVQAGLNSPTMVMMFDGDHAPLIDLEADTATQICIKNGGVKLDNAIGERWWGHRYTFYHPPYAPELPQMWCTMDVVSDYEHAMPMYNKVTKAMKSAIPAKWGFHLKTHFSHWYDWGTMIYPRWGVPVGPDSLKESLKLHDAIINAATFAALEAGAVMNDHHGVGIRLGHHMGRQFGKGGMNFMRAIKKGVDPKNIMCPGKLGLEDDKRQY